MITKSRLQELLDYNSNSGTFTWKVKTSNRVKINSVAGNIKNNGYHEISIDGKSYLAHRLAWLYVYGHLPTSILDHINGIRNDNRISNLREVGYKENTFNSKTRKDNKSGVRNVSWSKKYNKWEVRIKIADKLIHFGLFDSVEEARLVAEKERLNHQKEYMYVMNK